jgi:hypothetical protein
MLLRKLPPVVLKSHPTDMPFVDPDVPNRLNDLALYASLVATCVITLNVSLVKFARWVIFFRSRPRSRHGFRHRHPFS